MSFRDRKSASAIGREENRLVAIIGLFIVLFIVLYAARPKIESLDAFIDCPGCANSTKTHPGDDTTGSLPTINVRVKNTGQTRATVVRANSLLYSADPDGIPLRMISSSGYQVPFILSSNSEALLSQTICEMDLYEMREPTPARQFGRTFFKGEITYRGSLWFPVTTNFCFEYGRPSPPKAERWTACSI